MLLLVSTDKVIINRVDISELQLPLTWAWRGLSSLSAQREQQPVALH